MSDCHSVVTVEQGLWSLSDWCALRIGLCFLASWSCGSYSRGLWTMAGAMFFLQGPPWDCRSPHRGRSCRVSINLLMHRWIHPSRAPAGSKGIFVLIFLLGEFSLLRLLAQLAEVSSCRPHVISTLSFLIFKDLIWHTSPSSPSLHFPWLPPPPSQPHLLLRGGKASLVSLPCLVVIYLLPWRDFFSAYSI